MRTAVIGAHPDAEVRAEILKVQGGFRGSVEAADGVDLALIAVPAAERFEAAASALRAGAHVFLEWPPTSSIRECAQLVRLAEEAGLEAGVSRPLRFGLENLPDRWRARIVSLEMTGAVPISHALADVIDLSFMLARSASVRRTDAEAAYDGRRAMTSAAMSLRFHSGALAQAVLRSAGPPGRLRLYAVGMGREIECEVEADAENLRAETRQVLVALGNDRPVPVSALDALQTMRVVERVMGVLR